MKVSNDMMEETENYEYFLCGDYDVWYFGLIYGLHVKAGIETIKLLIKSYKKNGYIPFRSIFGAYRIILRNRTDHTMIFWADNSNMFTWYMRAGSFGDNFYDMLEKGDQYDYETLCEYLALGGCYFNRTLISEVTYTNNHKYYVLRDHTITEFDKKIGELGEPSLFQSLDDFFDNLIYSVQDWKICAAITGGFDSRMIAAQVQKRKDVELFISSSKDENKELLVARKVSESLGKKLIQITPETPERIDVSYVRQLFDCSQGIVGCFDSGFVRVFDYFKQLKNKGFDLILSGNAGDMYKDWWYTQDWPFYGKKKTDFEKLFSYRIEKISYRKFLGKNLDYPLMKLQFMKQLELERKEINTKSYDAYGYNINWAKAGIANNVYCTMNYYAPLQEYELVKYSFNLPNHEKVFNQLQRRITTEASRTAARIPTIYGMTESNEPMYLLRDYFFYYINIGKKVLRTIGRKIFKKVVFLETVDAKRIEDEIEKLPIVKDAIRHCEEMGIIKKMERYPYWIWSKCLLIYLLRDAIEEKCQIKET